MNIKNLFKFVLVWVALAGVLPATAAFKDVKIDLTNGNFLTETEIQDKSSVSFGVGSNGPICIAVLYFDYSVCCTWI